MVGSTYNFKENPSKTAAITGVFSVLYALFNFIAIPGFSSFEHVINFICAVLFGPYVAVIASVAGEVILFPINGIDMFTPSTLTANVLTALIIGFGRNWALKLERKKDWSAKKARNIAEGTMFLIAVFTRFLFYISIDAILLSAGIPLPNTLVFFVGLFGSIAAFKAAWLPVCLLIVDKIRNYMNVVYFDMEFTQEMKD